MDIFRNPQLKSFQCYSSFCNSSFCLLSFPLSTIYVTLKFPTAIIDETFFVRHYRIFSFQIRDTLAQRFLLPVTLHSGGSDVVPVNDRANNKTNQARDIVSRSFWLKLLLLKFAVIFSFTNLVLKLLPNELT